MKLSLYIALTLKTNPSDNAMRMVRRYMLFLKVCERVIIKRRGGVFRDALYNKPKF